MAIIVDDRDRLRVPFSEYHNVIKFEEHYKPGQHWKAVVGETVVSETHRLSQTADAWEAAVEAWKGDVFRQLAHLSTTVELRTACGCAQFVENPQNRAEIQVMLAHQSSAIMSVDSIEAMMKKKYRSFKYRGKLADSGLRLFMEQPG